MLELPVILMYGDPDPDAIGSGSCASNYLKGPQASPRWFATPVRHSTPSKPPLVQYLKEPIERLRESERAGADLVAVVDAQPGFWKENRPNAHAVIDHHPRMECTTGLYVDLRENYGSTCSILTEYLLEAEFDLSPLGDGSDLRLETDTA